MVSQNQIQATGLKTNPFNHIRRIYISRMQNLSSPSRASSKTTASDTYSVNAIHLRLREAELLLLYWKVPFVRFDAAPAVVFNAPEVLLRQLSNTLEESVLLWRSTDAGVACAH